jgi:hypothetical protein
VTTPVADDDIVSGATAYLMAQPEVLAVLGTYPGTTVPYLFQRRMWAEMKASSSTACMIWSEGGWTAANLHNTLRFPRLSVEIWTDPLRDGQNNVIDPGEVYRRSNRAFTVIDSFLHRPQGGTQWWYPNGELHPPNRSHRV